MGGYVVELPIILSLIIGQGLGLPCHEYPYQVLGKHWWITLQMASCDQPTTSQPHVYVLTGWCILLKEGVVRRGDHYKMSSDPKVESTMCEVMSH